MEGSGITYRWLGLRCNKKKRKNWDRFKTDDPFQLSLGRFTKPLQSSRSAALTYEGRTAIAPVCLVTTNYVIMIAQSRVKKPAVSHPYQLFILLCSDLQQSVVLTRQQHDSLVFTFRKADKWSRQKQTTDMTDGQPSAGFSINILTALSSDSYFTNLI